MKVFCISDSLGLPRAGVPYEDTWFYLVKESFPKTDFYPYFIRNLTTEALEPLFYNYISFFNPNYVIVQLGICDCSPRIVNTKKLFWKIYFKIFSSMCAEELGWKIVKKIFKRDNPERVYVSIDRFFHNNEKFINECINNSIKVLYVQIANPAPSLNKKSPAMFSNIQRYNEILIQLSMKHPDFVFVINPLAEGDINDYTEDGYHTKKEGAIKVARDVIQYLDSELLKHE